MLELMSLTSTPGLNIITAFIIKLKNTAWIPKKYLTWWQ